MLQGLDVLQPHFTIFGTSSGAAVTLSGKLMGASTLFSSSLLQPYRVGSTAGGSASIVASFGCKDCKEGADFLALDFFVHQDQYGIWS